MYIVPVSRNIGGCSENKNRTEWFPNRATPCLGRPWPLRWSECIGWHPTTAPSSSAESSPLTTLWSDTANNGKFLRPSERLNAATCGTWIVRTGWPVVPVLISLVGWTVYFVYRLLPTGSPLLSAVCPPERRACVAPYRNQRLQRSGLSWVPGCLGVPGGRLDKGSLWDLYKIHETLWFCLVSGLNSSVGVLGLCLVCQSAVQYLCRSISLHDCLVVNATSKFIINIPSRHGC